jgi:hypothetical protein
MVMLRATALSRAATVSGEGQGLEHQRGVVDAGGEAGAAGLAAPLDHRDPLRRALERRSTGQQSPGQHDVLVPAIRPEHQADRDLAMLPVRNRLGKGRMPQGGGEAVHLQAEIAGVDAGRAIDGEHQSEIDGQRIRRGHAAIIARPG